MRSRILTSQFTGSWLSPHRGTVPVSWAVDPLLATMFPALWNYYVDTSHYNDTFVTGVDGAGYVYIHELGKHTETYEARAGRLLTSKIGSDVVDVGVADVRWPAVTVPELEQYVINARRGGTAPLALLNACGSDYGQPVSYWLTDGTPVFNSVCRGPVPRNATTGADRHFLFYYRDYLDVLDPAADLADRIAWAATHKRGSTPTDPLFLVVFGGLGEWGGNDDLFKFMHRVLEHLDPDVFEIVGAREAALMAKAYLRDEKLFL